MYIPQEVRQQRIVHAKIKLCACGAAADTDHYFNQTPVSQMVFPLKQQYKKKCSPVFHLSSIIVKLGQVCGVLFLAVPS